MTAFSVPMINNPLQAEQSIAAHKKQTVPRIQMRFPGAEFIYLCHAWLQAKMIYVNSTTYRAVCTSRPMARECSKYTRRHSAF